MVETEEFDDVQQSQPKTKKRYPNGRIITICNGRVLYDEPNQLGFFPFVPITERPMLTDIYPPSTITHLIQPQKEYNKRRSQLADHAELCCNPIMIISSLAAIEQDTVANKPGARLVSMDGQSPDGGIRFVVPPPLGDEVGEGVVLSHQDIDEISSMHEINRGEEPQQARSGVALNILQQSGKTRTSWHSDNNDVGLLQVYRNAISMYLDFVDEARKYRFTDPESLEMMYSEFNPQEHILPNRQKRILEIQSMIEELQMQMMMAQEQGLAEEELMAIGQQIEERIVYLMSEIDIVEAMPAHDLVSFDITIQTGTRHLSTQAVASLSVQLKEMGTITDQTLLERLKFPGWRKAIMLKREENRMMAEAQEAATEAEFERERQLQREKNDQMMELEETRADTKIEIEEAATEGDIKLQEEKHDDAKELERIKGQQAVKVAKAKPKPSSSTSK